MTAKRNPPLTDEEKRARNRLYQHKRRHVDNNAYARAQRRAMQRVVKWFQENREATWTRWLNEELAKEREAASTGKAKAYKPRAGFQNAQEDCPHNGDIYAVGVSVACSLCGKVQGVVSVHHNDREELNEMIGGNPPE